MIERGLANCSGGSEPQSTFAVLVCKWRVFLSGDGVMLAI